MPLLFCFLLAAVVAVSGEEDPPPEVAADVGQFPNWRYEANVDTKHPGTRHKVLSTSQFNPNLVWKACANFCSLSKTCDAFSVAPDAGADDCTLIDVEMEDAANKDYVAEAGSVVYRKYADNAEAAAVTEAHNGDNAPNLQPCDDDETVLTAAECDDLPTEQVTYYVCSDDNDALIDTYALVKAERCSNEDRLLECELGGDEAFSNVPGLKMENLFLKATYQTNGLVTADTVTQIRADLFEPSSVSRVVLRSTNAPFVGSVIVAAADGAESSVAVDFASPSEGTACAAMINFSGITEATEAASLRLEPTSWNDGGVQEVKMDLFVQIP